MMHRYASGISCVSLLFCLLFLWTADTAESNTNIASRLLEHPFHSFHRSAPWKRVNSLDPRKYQQRHQKRHLNGGLRHIQGGGGTNDDEERYSRQVYTLGLRAHNLIRTTTVYVDGPVQSGLVYECAKNLALSGIRNLIVVTADDNIAGGDGDVERHYHDPLLDDLGQMYQRGARSEIFQSSGDEVISDSNLLVEYVRRLNPNIVVSSCSRSSLLEKGTRNDAVYLCVDRPYSTAITLNAMARQHGWAFIATETAGVFGRAFCDFGDDFVVHDVDGETPVVTPFDHIKRQDTVGASNLLVVTSVSGERHDVSKGDTIHFQFRGAEYSKHRFVVVEVFSPYKIIVRLEDESASSTVDDIIAQISDKANSYCRIKLPQQIQFYPIEKAISSAESDATLFTACDLDKSYDPIRRSTSLSCFQKLSEFVQTMRRLPSVQDIESFGGNGGDPGTPIRLSFLKCCAAKFTPLQALFGAIGAQEVLKAATGLYFPVRQLLVYDCDEVLSDSCDVDELAPAASNDRNVLPSCAGLRYILGDTITNRLESTKIFLVGAGAIGCEVLKNMAAMNIGTRSNGMIVLTDMDTIEKSNLSRQLLFRDGDVGKFKSTAAQEAANRLNVALKIEAHSSKVGVGDTKSPFNDAFWENKVDIVMNALDNVDARLFMDRECVLNKKGLVDAGTMGPKGNVQVIVPYQSESYASSVDPSEPSIPVCTLKNFPYAIAHTIQWARDLLSGLFERRSEQANDFMDSLQVTDLATIVSRYIRDNGAESAVVITDELMEDIPAITNAMPSNMENIRKESLHWAIKLADKLFNRAPTDLLVQHPPSSVDEDGIPFWSGTRRPPKSLAFDSVSKTSEQAQINENILQFIRIGARLRVECMLGTDISQDSSHFSHQDVKRELALFGGETRVEPDTTIDDVAALNKLKVGPNRMVAVEFEKDDETNGHVAFVTAASNLRAIAYGIPPVDAMETRRVAGNIIPAMITTTAFVSALSCLELVKLVQKANMSQHRNAFINLALPFFAFTKPLPAETISGLDGKEYTLWDQLTISESKKASASGGITMKSLMKQIRKKASDDPARVSVASISCGPLMLYANFLHEDDRDLLRRSIWDVVAEAVQSSESFDQENSRTGDDDASSGVVLNDSYVDLTVVVEDTETGDEVELPSLRVRRYRM